MSDNVKSPSHYRSDSGIEVIDAIEAWNLGFCKGNIIKYVARAGFKDPTKEIEDLEKAKWYLEREIKRLRANWIEDSGELKKYKLGEGNWLVTEQIDKILGNKNYESKELKN